MKEAGGDSFPWMLWKANRPSLPPHIKRPEHLHHPIHEHPQLRLQMPVRRVKHVHGPARGVPLLQHWRERAARDVGAGHEAEGLAHAQAGQ